MRRRTVLASVASGLAAGSLLPARLGAAQDAPTEMAKHPIVGSWNSVTPSGPAIGVFLPDGTQLVTLPATVAGPRGVEFVSTQAGRWEPISARGVHFTSVQFHSDANGVFTGSVTVDGYPVVSEDGQTLLDDQSKAVVTIRDAAGAVVQQIPGAGAPPVTGIRIGVGTPGFPAVAAVATPAATPAAGPVEGQMVHINGVDLYYEVHGPADGQPVLLLHGGLGNTEEFDGLVPPLLAAGYRTVAMDCRGRGRSTWDDAPITYELMATDALGLLDHLEIAKTDLVGWSDGAILGLELGIHHPERLNRVVAYGANFTPDGFHDPTPSPQLPPFEKFVADYQRLSPAPERFDELLAELDALYKVAPNYSEAQLKGITTPFLILDGAEEEMINADQPVRMAALIPGAKLVLIPGTGHFAPVAKPAEFNRIVLDFLQG